MVSITCVTNLSVSAFVSQIVLEWIVVSCVTLTLNLYFNCFFFSPQKNPLNKMKTKPKMNAWNSLYIKLTYVGDKTSGTQPKGDQKTAPENMKESAVKLAS